ncbi:MAG: hypothetical protein ACRCYO_08650 [Bacteroidia bacterium]
MCKKILFLFFSCCVSFTLQAQSGLTFQAGYRYQYAASWDSIFTVYNAARPWNEKALPFLIHGFECGAGYQHAFKNPAWAWGGSLLWSRISASAENNEREVSVNMNTFDLGLTGRVYPFDFVSEKHIPFAVALEPGLSFLHPTIKDNGERMGLDEEKKYGPFTPSFRLNTQLSYEFALGKNVIAPYLSWTWFPVAEPTDFASAVHGSLFTGLTDESVVHAFSGGLKFVWGLKKETTND